MVPSTSPIVSRLSENIVVFAITITYNQWIGELWSKYHTIWANIATHAKCHKLSVIAYHSFDYFSFFDFYHKMTFIPRYYLILSVKWHNWQSNVFLEKYEIRRFLVAFETGRRVLKELNGAFTRLLCLTQPSKGRKIDSVWKLRGIFRGFSLLHHLHIFLYIHKGEKTHILFPALIISLKASFVRNMRVEFQDYAKVFLPSDIQIRMAFCKIFKRCFLPPSPLSCCQSIQVICFQVLRNYLLSKNISVSKSIIWLSHQVPIHFSPFSSLLGTFPMKASCFIILLAIFLLTSCSAYLD